MTDPFLWVALAVSIYACCTLFPRPSGGTGAFGPNWQALNTSLSIAKRITRRHNTQSAD